MIIVKNDFQVNCCLCALGFKLFKNYVNDVFVQMGQWLNLAFDPSDLKTLPDHRLH